MAFGSIERTEIFPIIISRIHDINAVLNHGIIINIIQTSRPIEFTLEDVKFHASDQAILLILLSRHI